MELFNKPPSICKVLGHQLDSLIKLITWTSPNSSMSCVFFLFLQMSSSVSKNSPLLRSRPVCLLANILTFTIWLIFPNIPETLIWKYRNWHYIITIIYHQWYSALNISCIFGTYIHISCFKVVYDFNGFHG